MKSLVKLALAESAEPSRMTGTPLALTPEQEKARAMPRNTPEEQEARRFALRKANDNKYRQRIAEGWEPAKAIQTNRAEYARQWYEKNREYLINLATIRNRVRRGELKQEAYEAKKQRNINAAEKKAKIVVKPVAPCAPVALITPTNIVYYSPAAALVQLIPNYFVSWD